MFDITLNENEQKFAEYLAKKRWDFNRDKGTPHLYSGPQPDEQTDVEGMGGELAYCKLMNIYPDFETNPTEMPTYDCVSRLGVRIDVKTTKFRSGHLIAPLAKAKKPPDKYVLVVGEIPTYSIVGEVWAVDLLHEGNLKDFGYGNCYAVTQVELNPIMK
mgnify:FL=1